jgi:hypothetical protein
VPLALLARTSSASFCEKVTLLGGTCISPTRPVVLTPGAGVVSAVRSRNVTRVNKSYESFGDRFSTTVIDELVTSDLSDAVKGMRCVGPLFPVSWNPMAEHILGVDAIIHVASPLPHANADVVLDVRSSQAFCCRATG